MRRNNISTTTSNIFDVSELVINVLSRLPRSTLLKVATVCKQWHVSAYLDSLWTIRAGDKDIVSNRDIFIAHLWTLPLFMKRYILNQEPDIANPALAQLFPQLALTVHQRMRKLREDYRPYYTINLTSDLLEPMTLASAYFGLIPDIAQIAVTVNQEEAQHIVNTTSALLRNYTVFNGVTFIRELGFFALTQNLLTFNEACLLHHNNDNFIRTKLEILIDQKDYSTLKMFQRKNIPIEKVASNLCIPAIYYIVSNDQAFNLLAEDLLTIDEVAALKGHTLRYLSNDAGKQGLQNKFTCLSREEVLTLDEKLALLLFACNGIYLIENKKMTLEELKQKQEKYNLDGLYQNASGYNPPSIIFSAIHDGLLTWENIDEFYAIAEPIVQTNYMHQLFCDSFLLALQKGQLTPNKIIKLLKRSDCMETLELFNHKKFMDALSLLTEPDNPAPKPEVSVVPSSVFAPKSSGTNTASEQKYIIDQSFELF